MWRPCGIWSRAHRTPRSPVDLNDRTVRASDQTYTFELDDYTRWRLLEGLDDTALALAHADAIEEYERNRRPALPRTKSVSARDALSSEGHHPRYGVQLSESGQPGGSGALRQRRARNGSLLDHVTGHRK
jgi:hypothetical protein